MNFVMVGFVVVTVLMYVIAFVFSPETVAQGLGISYKTLTDPEIGLIPLVVTATLISGLVQAAVPRKVMSSFLGEEAGLKGIGLGALLGMVVPGRPYTIFPLAGGIYKAGAGVGTIIAFITAWSLVSLSRIPTELPFLGTKMVTARILVSLTIPIILGALGQTK